MPHKPLRYILIIDYGQQGRTEEFRWRWQAYKAADEIKLNNYDAGYPVYIMVRDRKKGKVLRTYGTNPRSERRG